MIGYTHRYDSLYPYNNRRCGYIFDYWSDSGLGVYWYGTTDGHADSLYGSTGGKSYCPQTVTNGHSGWSAACDYGIDNDSHRERISGMSCPKGWGRSKLLYPVNSYTVYGAQGWVADTSKPSYSTVTKYRDTVYNYTAGRIAKA